jgi:hypothetical protein
VGTTTHIPSFGAKQSGTYEYINNVLVEGESKPSRKLEVTGCVPMYFGIAQTPSFVYPIRTMKKTLFKTVILLTVCCTLKARANGCDPERNAIPNTQHAIRITNYKNNTTIRHPVPLIRGILAEPNEASVTVINTSSTRPTRKIEGLARKGKFKALAELVPGKNKLLIKAGKAELPLTLNYKPQTNPYIVRAFFLTDKTGATEYQTPIENDAQDYRGKLGTAMKLMQTFTAERMYDLGFGRITFNLEFDDTGKVIVRTLKGDKTADHYHKMRGLDLYYYAGDLIKERFPNDYAKNLVIPAFTRFSPETKKTYAHTALGAGRLALFGGANIFTWPDSIDEAQKAFMNTTRIDTTKFFSDSVERHTFWAAASTTIGAALHELGHTFALPHSQSHHDIMTRGFDRFNRALTLIEPPHARHKTPYEFNEEQIARWDAPSAVWIKSDRWFALDKKNFTEQNKTVATADENLRTITIQSENGIGGIVLGPRGLAAGHVPIDYNKPPPQKVRVSMADFGNYLAGEEPEIRIIDTQGLTKTIPLQDLMPTPFVRTWRFAPLTAPWTDPKKFVPVDNARLQAITESARSVAPATSPVPFIDFLPHFPNEKRHDIAGYAVRTFNSEKTRNVKFFTGSDDALRIWLNGELITKVLALRSAAKDAESANARIRKGENTIVAEVSQRAGGWGLYLRIADKDGSDLIITDDDKITEFKP